MLKGRLYRTAFTTPSVPASLFLSRCSFFPLPYLHCKLRFSCASLIILQQLVISRRRVSCSSAYSNYHQTDAHFAPGVVPLPPILSAASALAQLTNVTFEQTRSERYSRPTALPLLYRHNGASWRVVQQSPQEVQVRNDNLVASAQISRIPELIQ